MTLPLLPEIMKGRFTELHWPYCVDTQEDWWHLKVLFPKRDTWASSSTKTQSWLWKVSACSSGPSCARSHPCCGRTRWWHRGWQRREGSAAGTVSPCVCLKRARNLWVKFLGNSSSSHHTLHSHPVCQLSLNVVIMLWGSSCVLPIYGEHRRGSKVSDNRGHSQFLDKKRTRSNGWSETYTGLK